MSFYNFTPYDGNNSKWIRNSETLTETLAALIPTFSTKYLSMIDVSQDNRYKRYDGSMKTEITATISKSDLSYELFYKKFTISKNILDDLDVNFEDLQNLNTLTKKINDYNSPFRLENYNDEDHTITEVLNDIINEDLDIYKEIVKSDTNNGFLPSLYTNSLDHSAQTFNCDDFVNWMYEFMTFDSRYVCLLRRSAYKMLFDSVPVGKDIRQYFDYQVEFKIVDDNDIDADCLCFEASKYYLVVDHHFTEVDFNIDHNAVEFLNELSVAGTYLGTSMTINAAPVGPVPPSPPTEQLIDGQNSFHFFVELTSSVDHIQFVDTGNPFWIKCDQYSANGGWLLVEDGRLPLVNENQHRFDVYTPISDTDLTSRFELADISNRDKYSFVLDQCTLPNNKKYSRLFMNNHMMYVQGSYMFLKISTGPSAMFESLFEGCIIEEFEGRLIPAEYINNAYERMYYNTEFNTRAITTTRYTGKMLTNHSFTDFHNMHGLNYNELPTFRDCIFRQQSANRMFSAIVPDTAAVDHMLFDRCDFTTNSFDNGLNLNATVGVAGLDVLSVVGNGTGGTGMHQKMVFLGNAWADPNHYPNWTDV